MSNVILTFTPERIAEARDRAAMAAMVDVDTLLLALDDIEHASAEVERLRKATLYAIRELSRAGFHYDDDAHGIIDELREALKECE